MAFPQVGTVGVPARQASLRRHNLALVLGELATSGPLARADLARRTGLTKATISGFVDALLAAGVAEEVRSERPAGTPGRPASPVRLGPRAPVAVGVEIGVDFLAGCVVDLAGEVLARRARPCDNRVGEPTARLAEAVDLASSLASALGPPTGRVVGVGVALPGIVGPDGRIRSAPNLAGWNGLAVEAALSAQLTRAEGALGGREGDTGGPPLVELGNEADLAALGERWYGGHGELGDFALVSAEVGVGAGIVVDGRLFTGATGAAGELGHLTVDPDGIPCGCGSRGCLERYAGQEALLEAAGQPDRAALRAAVAAGEARSTEALARAGRALGVAAAALVNLVDVPALVLGGLYAELAPVLAPILAAELATRAVRHLWDPVQLLVSRLGPEAAMRGAAGAVLQRVLTDPLAHLPGVLG